MDSLEYQRRLAEFDEKITYHKARAEGIEHDRARFVLDVLTATQEAKRKESLSEGISIVNKGQLCPMN